MSKKKPSDYVHEAFAEITILRALDLSQDLCAADNVQIGEGISRRSPHSLARTEFLLDPRSMSTDIVIFTSVKTNQV